MRRSSALLATLGVLALALSPGLAEARAGSGASMGSRGSRSYSAPPSTGTAPYAASPLERSVTPQASPYYNAPSGGGYAAPARSGFGSGLLGGLVGVGLGSMLFGHGLFGEGGASGFGFIGLLIQLALLFFIGRWVLRRVLGMGPRPAFAGMPRMGQPAPQGMAFGGGGMAGAQAVTVTPADYQAFDATLKAVQAAWSAQNVAGLQQVATPEMVSYFSEQLADQASRGVRNTVTEVKLEKGDLSEAWSEGGRVFATVAMRFSMIDVTRDASGRVVDGSATERTVATEIWTFLRASGGRWLLSAIQQGR